MMKKLILPLALLAVVSCSRGPLYEGGARIFLRPTVGAATKGARTTTGTLSSFRMDVIAGEANDWSAANAKYIDGMVVKGSGSAWDTYTSDGSAQKDYYWPDETPLYFWGWSPATPNGTLEIVSQSPAGDETQMQFSFTVASDVAYQDDLILSFNGESRDLNDDYSAVSAATSTNSSYTRDDQYVDVVFSHALSEVSFAVSTDDGTFSPLTVVSIVVEGVAASGSCVYTGTGTDEGFVWTPSSTTASYTLSLNTDFSSAPASDDANWSTGSYTKDSNEYNLFTTRERMFLIPQDLSATGVEAYVAITFERGGEQATKRVPIDDVWKPGEYYKYKIKAQKATADIYVSCELAVLDWVDGTTHVDL